MPRVFALSSFLAHGRVGLGATVPVLQSMGHEVIQLPTVILSNHPGHARVAGRPVEADRLRAMLGALEGNGWLADIAAIVTGYLPTPAHVAFAAVAVREVRRHSPSAIYVCDPILGDDPKGLYIDADAAAAIRDLLLPLADVMTPNRFELSWLTGLPVTDASSCSVAARTCAAHAVVATSIPAGRDAEGNALIGNVLVTKSEQQCLPSMHRSGVPHGTGDVFTALLTGHLVSDTTPLVDAFLRGQRQLESIIADSAGQEHLDLSRLTRVANLP
jgi:pyridoxine kinase